MYLVQYADHDHVTRELSLLSINSFQRGLADSEQLIRALALRVLSSIRVSDVLQIQILGVQKCAKDGSPYVRKCAANALAKLSPRCDASQREMLLEIMTNLLVEDSSTMVLTSTIVAFSELCPDRLELLHSCFRKVCHLLTDMDEWGQVVVIDTMARYIRKFFRKPRTAGSAEAIDRARRVRRTVSGICAAAPPDDPGAALDDARLVVEDSSGRPRRRTPQKIKRRVVKKGFYSDEEDATTEEEVYADASMGTALTLSSALRDRTASGGMAGGVVDMTADEDDELHEDHRLFLRSSLPLLKSRNSGVVLSVCSLHYYCGVASVKVRSALGKALVRIHRNRREIQYVVLSSIRTLVGECPSAFTPFLNDFFVTVRNSSNGDRPPPKVATICFFLTHFFVATGHGSFLYSNDQTRHSDVSSSGTSLDRGGLERVAYIHSA
jgi:AP-3 complex subunit beta